MLPQAYQARLRGWHGRSSVRSAPRHELDQADEGLPFSRELVSLASHHLVETRGPGCIRLILGSKLHSYFRFTTQLEMKAIVPVCSMLAVGEIPVQLPAGMALDALKIATDEAYHALCAEDVKAQFAAAIGVLPVDEMEPAFISSLRRLKDCHRRRFPLVMLIFACVSETLITGTLAKIPNDSSVLKVVRDTVHNHARDESKHHMFFSKIIQELWEQLKPAGRDFAGPLFAQFVQEFLSPNLQAEVDWLRAAGFNIEEAKKIITETYSPACVSNIYKFAAAPTLMLLTKFGVMDHQATRDAFAERGIV